MSSEHLRLVHDPPPDLDDGDDGEGGGDDEIFSIDLTLSADEIHGARVILLEGSITPESIAMAVLSACRGAIAAYGNTDVSMAWDRLLLSQGVDPSV